MPEPKYASAREDGLKPWLVTVIHRGGLSDRIVYAETAAAAKYEVLGGMQHTWARARPATPAEIEEGW